MIEFAVVGPVLTLLGLALLQYGLLFFAKNGFNHAAFMAARAGAVGNASLSSVQQAYLRALVPLYGGGRNSTELAEAYARAQTDAGGHLRIELLNPTQESFDDWNDPALQRTLGQGRRVIPNGNLAFKDPEDIKNRSGQNIHDANLIKLRFTQGYAPQVPLVRQLYSQYLKWRDPGTDAFHSQLVAEGRIPVVTHVTLQMQSDAIEPDQPVSMPGLGNNGQPGDPDDPPVVDTPPPGCAGSGCAADSSPTDPTTTPDAPDAPSCGGAQPTPLSTPWSVFATGGFGSSSATASP